MDPVEELEEYAEENVTEELITYGGGVVSHKGDRTFIKEMNYSVYCVTGTVIYFAVAAIPAFLVMYIPDLNTHSKLFKKVTYRGDTFYSSYIPIGNLVYYLIMNVMGYTFVNLINLQNERKNPFLDAHYSSASFWKVVCIYTPINFMISTMFMMKGIHDETGFCSHRSAIADCNVYTKKQVFDYNYFVWTAGFFLGLQFTHMDQGIMKHFVLDWSVMKTWPW